MSKHTGLIMGSLIIVVLLGVAVFGILMLGVFPSGNTTTQTETSQTGCLSSGCVRKLPIRFIFNNLYTSQPITDSITATIYRGTTQVDSSSFSRGLWDTTKADFQSADSYAMYVTSANSKYEFTFQVPLAQNLTQPRFQITLNMALIGAYTISLLAPDGVTPITSSYNATSGICNGITSCRASKQPTFTVILTNNADNTGLTGTFQRIEVLQNGMPRTLVANALVVTESGTGGAPAKSHIIGQTGTAYVGALPDHATDKQRNRDGSLSQNAKGEYVTTLVLDTSGMSANSVETITVTYYAYLGIAYFNANNTPNSEAVVLTSYTFQIAS